MTGTGDDTVQVLQNGLKNTIPMRRANPNLTLRCHGDDEQVENRSSKEYSRWHREFDKHQGGNDNIHVFDKSVRDVRPGTGSNIS